MRKLIETTQENTIECDNLSCDFEIPNESEDPNAPLDKYLNQPCPKCGGIHRHIHDTVTDFDGGKHDIK